MLGVNVAIEINVFLPRVNAEAQCELNFILSSWLIDICEFIRPTEYLILKLTPPGKQAVSEFDLLF